MTHLRLVLGDQHTLVAAADATELDAMLRVEDPDLLVVDPATGEAQSAEAIEAIVARHPALPVIVYTTLAPASMRLVVRLARLGMQHVVLNRFDDQPRRFLDLIERVPAHPVADLMLQELAPELQELPVVLARAVEQLMRSPSRVRNGQELATLAGMTTRTLYRHLLPVGLSARHLIVAARLLRAYTFLRGSDSRLKEVALKLGYADPGLLSEQLRDWTGQAPKDIRRLLPSAEYVRRLADYLRHAGAPDEGAGERAQVSAQRVRARGRDEP